MAAATKVTNHNKGYRISCGKNNGKEKVWWLGRDKTKAKTVLKRALVRC